MPCYSVREEGRRIALHTCRASLMRAADDLHVWTTERRRTKFKQLRTDSIGFNCIGMSLSFAFRARRRVVSCVVNFLCVSCGSYEQEVTALVGYSRRWILTDPTCGSNPPTQHHPQPRPKAEIYPNHVPQDRAAQIGQVLHAEQRSAGSILGSTTARAPPRPRAPPQRGKTKTKRGRQCAATAVLSRICS